MAAIQASRQWTGDEVATLVGTVPDARTIAAMPSWSRDAAAAAAASLANTSGGVVIAGAALDDEGRLSSLIGTDLTEAELEAAVEELGPVGRHLAAVRVLEVAGKNVGLLLVAECGSPPVMVESDGGIYHRTEAGLARVRTRAELDTFVEKDRRLRERAETNIQGMTGRIAFGHFNYMTVALVAAPRFPGAAAYDWATANEAALLDTAFARRWGFSAEHIRISAGEVELALPADVTGFIRIARNGCVAVGEHQKRPPQHVYLPAEELAAQMAELADVASLPCGDTKPGLVLGSLYLEGVRDLRLPVNGSFSAPPAKDLVQTLLAERYLDDAAERAAFAQELQQAAGNVFGVDLVKGTVLARAARSPNTSTRRGQTKRTERRLSGARGHGSA